ncbi:hypothetical protein ACQJBY_072632 [Aegilops geniculata]
MGKDKKIDYAPAEVSTRNGISGVEVRISYSQNKKGRAISETCSRGREPDGTQLGFGRYGTKSCRAGRLSYRAIEAARRATIGQFHRAMSGQFRRNCKIWVRVLADLPITGKPTEVRMGRGKGNPTGWIARVSTGQIPFEMDGLDLGKSLKWMSKMLSFMVIYMSFFYMQPPLGIEVPDGHVCRLRKALYGKKATTSCLV